MIKMYPACRIHTQTWRSSVVLCFSPVLMEESFHLFFFFSLSLWDQSLGSHFVPFFFFFLSFWALIIVFPLMLSKAHINCVLSFSPLSTALSVDDGPPLPCMKLKVTVCCESSKYSPLSLFFFLPGERKKKPSFLAPSHALRRPSFSARNPLAYLLPPSLYFIFCFLLQLQISDLFNVLTSVSALPTSTIQIKKLF